MHRILHRLQVAGPGPAVPNVSALKSFVRLSAIFKHCAGSADGLVDLALSGHPKRLFAYSPAHESVLSELSSSAQTAEQP
jgi:hypothetical protein